MWGRLKVEEEQKLPKTPDETCDQPIPSSGEIIFYGPSRIIQGDEHFRSGGVENVQGEKKLEQQSSINEENIRSQWEIKKSYAPKPID